MELEQPQQPHISMIFQGRIYLSYNTGTIERRWRWRFLQTVRQFRLDCDVVNGTADCSHFETFGIFDFQNI